MKDAQKFGRLLTPDAKIHRQYFREMVKLIGIYVLYRAPLDRTNQEGSSKTHLYDKHYSMYGELDATYEKPMMVGCIFDQHPTQQTLKKIGWVSELSDGASLIHVDYDLPNLQQGALFIVPSGLDDGKGRLFRVVKMSNTMMYPASITCEIVPEYIDTFDDMTGQNVEDFIANEDLNFLGEEEVGPVSNAFPPDDHYYWPTQL